MLGSSTPIALVMVGLMRLILDEEEEEEEEEEEDEKEEDEDEEDEEGGIGDPCRCVLDCFTETTGGG